MLSSRVLWHVTFSCGVDADLNVSCNIKKSHCFSQLLICLLESEKVPTEQYFETSILLHLSNLNFKTKHLHVYEYVACY